VKLQVLNIKRNVPPNSVFVGRPTIWGNPFWIGRVHGTREQVIEKFRRYLQDRPDLIERARQELRGKNLICFCAPLPCHADVLLEVANVPS